MADAEGVVAAATGPQLVHWHWQLKQIQTPGMCQSNYWIANGGKEPLPKKCFNTAVKRFSAVEEME